MKAVHRKRLLKLAAFLAGPVARAEKRIGKRKLEMSYYATGYDKAPLGTTIKSCGTSGCALGWATVAFSRQWILTSSGYPVLRTDKLVEPQPLYNAMEFFGLPIESARHAFGMDERTVKQEADILRKLARG